MKKTSSVLFAACMLALVGCSDDVATTGAVGPAITAPKAGPAKPAAAAEADAGVPTLQVRDEAFVESSTNRDPFRSYAKTFKIRPIEGQQREVVMSTTGIDEMKLIAIVSGVTDPRAMLTDGHGVGYTVRRGDFLGRPEVVQTGGEEGMGVTLNWRVDRIRADEVVLTREDPTAQDRPPLTRVLPLHIEGEAAPK